MKKANFMPVTERNFPVLGPQSEDIRGQDSLLIHGRGRVCLAWRQGNADDVEIVDNY
jgi:hypothetical protein